MTFWVQHGYGKASKIQGVAGEDSFTGVVLSPADEDLSRLVETANTLRSIDAQTLLDPQLYVHTINGAAARCHESNGLDFGEISWFISPTEIATQVDAVVLANKQLGTDIVIAPAPYQASFGDVWTPLSLQYGRATIEKTDSPVYLSMIAESAAFSDWDQTQQYMDALTTLEAQGIYLIVGNSGRTYPLLWDPVALANVLRVIYTLGEFNEYEILWGYSDLAGLAGLAAGATGSATGWFNSLRMWTTGKWIPKSGGRPANPRLFANPLMSPLERSGEAASVAMTSVGALVFPDSNERDSLLNDEPWGIADSWQQHLNAMARLHETVDMTSPIPERVNHLRLQIQSALQLLTEAISDGAAVAASYHTQLQAVDRALELFSELENL